MISLSLHVPSILVGFLIGYITVSIIWIASICNENWSKGFGDGYNACRKLFENKSEQTKTDDTRWKQEQ